jgi:peptidyl-tRNA hydrolase, PTH1 family
MMFRSKPASPRAWWRSTRNQREEAGVADDAWPWLVAGLGNPGREYAGNRHNIGFMVADLLAARAGVTFGRHRRAVAEVAEGRLGFGGPRLILAKPLTYMNLSGGPVAALAQFFKIPPHQVIAVHDELDIPYGQLRVKIGGGEGGHNGLRSMSRSLGTKDYVRVRVGVGRPSGRQDPADHVLSDFSAAERKDLEFMVDRSADAVESVVTEGVERTQNAYHGG